MKKVLAILVIAMFIGGITAPAFASDNISSIDISQFDDDPKKDKKTKKESSETKAAVKTSDCGAKTSGSDCATKCGDKAKATEAKASDCSTKVKEDCGGK